MEYLLQVLRISCQFGIWSIIQLSFRFNWRIQL